MRRCIYYMTDTWFFPGHIWLTVSLLWKDKLFSSVSFEITERNCFGGMERTLLSSSIKGPLLGLKHFLKIENPSKMMKNVFYFMLKALFVLEFTFLFWLFGYVERQLDKKRLMVNFKIYDFTEWTANNYNTHITQYLKK